MLCRTEFLSHVILPRSQCHTAAAEGAKLSTIDDNESQQADNDLEIVLSQTNGYGLQQANNDLETSIVSKKRIPTSKCQVELHLLPKT